ncbi:MAG: hypothetical protein WC854_04185 [Bacteroidales bacterium]
MKEQLIICPHCNKKFPLSEAMKYEIEEKVKSDHQKELDELVEEHQLQIENAKKEAAQQAIEQPQLPENESRTGMNFTIEEQNEHQSQIKINADLFSCPMILVFTSMQNVYKVNNQKFNSLPQIVSGLEFEKDEKPIYFTGTANYSGYLIVAFQNGKVGKISMTSFQTEHNRRKLKNAFNNESKLIFVELIENDIDLVAMSSINKVVLFNTDKINPVESRTTKGIQVMKQKSGSVMLKVKKLNQTKLQDPEYYRKDECLNVIGYYLKHGDEI